MKVEDSFKLLLLFAVALTIVLAMVAFIFRDNKPTYVQVPEVESTEDELVEEMTNKEKKKMLDQVWARYEGMDTRSVKEKEIDNLDKIAELDNTWARYEGMDTRSVKEKEIDNMNKVELLNLIWE
jgi:hypothetical protein